ncbi:MAG: metallophosphatase domain-containing protein [Parachlamydia sp.]|nr:metallophosphatase domain-containing protein [Parachlamydia sp.]
MITITCISDLHGYEPELAGGDLLIVAGDLTARDTLEEYDKFNNWLASLPYQCKIVIAGNHDKLIEKGMIAIEKAHLNIHYLCDSGMEFKGLKIWGSPYTARFPGQNKLCMAFSVQSEFQLQDHFDLIPSDVDILITHSPPYGILDECANGRVGSRMLRLAVFKVNPRLLCFGHIHEQGGKSLVLDKTTFVNASVVNEYYQHVNDPLYVTLV